MYKFIKKLILIISSISIFFIGHFLDISDNKKETFDILVSLGGDNGNRIKKTLSIYQDNYSKSNKLIITGIDNFDKNMKIFELDWRANYLIKKGIKKENIIYNNSAENTLEEIFFIKRYMIKNNLSTVAIISDAPHSRRIHFFANTVAKFKEAGINLTIIASENNWWNKNSYFTNPEAIIFTINEIIKLTYYYINFKLGKYDEY